MARNSEGVTPTRKTHTRQKPGVKTLAAPAYSDKEQQAVIDFMLALKKSQIQDFLHGVDLPKSGSKSELRERFQEALDEGRIRVEQLLAYLDAVVIWGKQHVYLFKGPRGDISRWKDPQHLFDKLERQGLGDLFNARLPLVLPDELTLSSITHAAGRVRMTAIQKRKYMERAPELDKADEIEGSGEVFYKAHIPHVSRTLVAFEWDLNANVAMLQITQLNQDTLYEEVAKTFFKLVSDYMDATMFAPVDVRAAIRKLHEMADNGNAEARFHGIKYRTLMGSLLSAISPSPRDSVFADETVDGAMAGVARSGVGHMGNFYWLAESNGNGISTPLKNDVHLFIVGDKHRINFPTSNTEEVVRHVLHRVRQLS